MTAGERDARALRHLSIDDPATTTPFEVVHEGELLRLRHYRAADGPARKPPVLLVYSLFKRPYLLDLLPDRSMVRSFLRDGFSVYVTDWLPPGANDSDRGFDAYVNGDLASAVACVQNREAVERVSLVGCCLGGMLSVVYAALYPQSVQHLVPVALPLEMHPPLAPEAVEYLVRSYGNVPAWWIRAGLNAGVPGPFHLPFYLAEALGEPELAQSAYGSPPPVQLALQRWLSSDVPLAGRMFAEMMRDVYWDGRLAASRLRVAGKRVALEQIRCPVLNISGAHDRLVPPSSTAGLTERVGAHDASNLVFPTGHLGLFVGLAAQQSLWPRVGAWLRQSPSRLRPRDGAPLRLVA